MSVTTNTQALTPTTLDPTVQFSAYVHNLAEQCQKVHEEQQASGLTLELVEKAQGLDLLIRSAFKHLAKSRVADRAVELNDLLTATTSLIQSTIISSNRLTLLLQDTARIILKEQTMDPTEILAQANKHIDPELDVPSAIYEEMARLVGTPAPGEMSPVEHGKTLFEDKIQDRGTKAQAVFNVAHLNNVMHTSDFQDHSRFYQTVGRTDQVYAKKMTELYPHSIEEQEIPQEVLQAFVRMGTGTPGPFVIIPASLEMVTSDTPTNEQQEGPILPKNFAARMAKLTNIFQDIPFPSTTPVSVETSNTQTITTTSTETTQTQKPIQTEVTSTASVNTEVQSTQAETPNSHAPVNVQATKTEATTTAPVNTEVQSTQTETPNSHAPVNVQATNTEVTTKTPVNTEVQSTQTETPNSHAPVAQSTNKEVTTTVNTVVQPLKTKEEVDADDAVKAYHKLKAQNRSLSRKEEEVPTTEVELLLLQAENELNNDALTFTETNPQEKLDLEAATCVADVNDAEADLRRTQDKIGANNVAITNAEEELNTLTAQQKETQQKVDSLRNEEQQAIQRLEVIKIDIAQAQKALADSQQNENNTKAFRAQCDAEAQKAEDLVKEPSSNKTKVANDLRELVRKMTDADKALKDHEQTSSGINKLVTERQELFNEQIKTVARKKAEADAAENEGFKFPMQITDVQKRIDQAQQEKAQLAEETRVKETAVQNAKNKQAEIDKQIVALQLAQAPLKPEERREKLQAVRDALLVRAFYGEADPAKRSALVMSKLEDITQEDQERIKEYVLEHSKDPAKTKENRWIELHIGDNVELAYQAIEDTIKNIK